MLTFGTTAPPAARSRLRRAIHLKAGIRKIALSLAAFAALAGLSFACSDSSPPDSLVSPAAPPAPNPPPAETSAPEPEPTPAIPSVISHSAAVSENNPLIVFVSVALSAPGRVAVEYENEYAGKFRTAFGERAVERRVPVARLRANTVYEYAVVVENPGGGAPAYGARGEFTTGALPDRIAAVPTKATGRSSQPLILTDARPTAERPPTRHLLMWDELGEVVWQYRNDDGTIPNTLRVMRVQPNGDMIYIDKGRGSGTPSVVRTPFFGDAAYDIDFDGDTPHHDFIVLDDGRILYVGLYYLPDHPDARADTINLTPPIPRDGAGIERFKAERVWDSSDFYGVENYVYMNSISPSRDGGWIASLRYQDQVISISPDFQTIRWRLGGEDSDFDFPEPADKFHRQHTATELPNGNILLFDNEADLPGGGNYSRALELRLDFDSMTAVKAWEFSPEPPMRSRAVSSAYRLDNGNTLVNFGWTDSPADASIAVIEVDAEGRETFRLETGPAPRGELEITRYRASPGPESVIGETTLRPPKER